MKITKQILLSSLLSMALVFPSLSLAQGSLKAGASLNTDSKDSMEIEGSAGGSMQGSAGAMTDTDKDSGSMMESDTDSGSSAEMRRGFVMPHVLEASGTINVASGDVDGDGFKGIKMFVDSNGDGTMGKDEMNSLEAGKSGPEVLTVDGSEVRGWDPKTKEAVMARLEANDAKNQSNDFGLYVAMQAINNDHIKDITVSDKGLNKGDDNNATAVSVRYTATIKLLGLFNIDVPAVASVNVAGEPTNTFDTNWLFNLLSTKGDQSAYINLASDIKTKRDVASGMATGK